MLRSDDSELYAHFDANVTREHLLSVAILYAESLRNRLGLVGILLYGSLARGGVTPFSDIDIALFYKGSPAYGIERRLVQGVKVDLISFPLEDVTKLLDPIPRSLDVGFPFSYVLESLLLAGDDSILYDPTGELMRVKMSLGGEVTFQTLNRVSLSDGYHKFYRVSLDKAKFLLELGDFAGALDKAKWAGGSLAYLLRLFVVSKDTREAAERLGISEFAGKREDLALIVAPSNEALEEVLDATQELWDYTVRAAAEPVKQCIRVQGFAEPDKLELAGDYDLFWPGYSLNELGRVMGEVTLSLRLCRYELNRGDGEKALQQLWGCRGTQGIRYRWERLAAALKDTGYDCSSVIEAMLEDAEFVQLGERLDRAMNAIKRGDVMLEAVQRALALTEEMERMLVEAIPFAANEG